MTSDAFLIIFLVFIALITILPAILKRWGIPSIIALLVVGMLIGPNALNLLKYLTNGLAFLGREPDIVYNNFSFLISALGSLGLVFLMALAGMEADFKMIDSVKKPVILLSILTFSIPAVTGYFVYAHFCPDDLPGKLLYASLFASHSVGIVFPVIRDLKLTKTRFGASVLISTVATDVSSIILLAVSVQLKKLQTGEFSETQLLPRGISVFDYLDPSYLGDWFTPVFLLMVILFMTATVLLVSKIGKLVIQWTNPGDDAIVTCFLLLIMLAVLGGEFLGINLIVGAFIAGMSLSSLVKSRENGSALFFKFETIGYGLLIPFLFISIGMGTDFRVFNSAGNWEIVLLTVIGLVGSKTLSGYVAMRLSGFCSGKAICAGLMTVPQLSATLAAAAIGKTLGMLDDNFFNAIIVLSIVTTIPIPLLVRYLIGKWDLSFNDVEEEVYKLPDGVDDDLL